MANQGFEEARTPFGLSAATAPAAGQFRRFGEFGPAYEVVRLVSSSHAAIRVVYSGEQLDYSLDRLLQDPIAETIP